MAVAGGHDATPTEAAIKARQAHMSLYGFNLGVLGGMAKGNVEFSAELAQGAAGNIVALATMSQGTYWIPGSDNSAAKGTRALPGLWENFPKAMEISGGFVEAAKALEAASGDLDSMRAALGPVGKACSECHKAFRAPAN